MKSKKFIRLICSMYMIFLLTNLVHGEPNVWLQSQGDRESKLIVNDKQITQRYATIQDAGSDSPYFFYKYDSKFRPTRVPLILSDKEIAINFVSTPSINIKRTFESENLFIFVPTDFKCRPLRPTLEQVQEVDNVDSLYAEFNECRANLPIPLSPEERSTYQISSIMSDEDFQTYLEMIAPPNIWRIHRRFNSTDEEVMDQIERLRMNPDIERVWAMFFTPDDFFQQEPITPNDLVTVVFRDGIAESQIRVINEENGTEIAEIQNGIYKLKSKSGGGILALELAEKYRQNPVALVARPNFYSWFNPFGIVTPLDEPERFIIEGRYRIDYNKSGTSDFEDFVLFASGFGNIKGDTSFESRFDLDDNGVIGFWDFVKFAKRYTN